MHAHSLSDFTVLSKPVRWSSEAVPSVLGVTIWGSLWVDVPWDAQEWPCKSFPDPFTWSSCPVLWPKHLACLLLQCLMLSTLELVLWLFQNSVHCFSPTIKFIDVYCNIFEKSHIQKWKGLMYNSEITHFFPLYVYTLTLQENSSLSGHTIWRYAGFFHLLLNIFLSLFFEIRFLYIFEVFMPYKNMNPGFSSDM